MAPPWLPLWHWAYVLFRLADGASHALISLVPLLIHGMPLWTVPATVAAMNVVSVPASFLWGALMERTKGSGRRRLALTGFTISAASMLTMAASVWLGAGEPWAILLYLVATVLFAAFGLATAPAAAVLILDGVPGKHWSNVTGRLSRGLGWSHMVGLTVMTAWGLSGTLRFEGAFLACGVAAAAAAIWAGGTIEPLSKAERSERRTARAGRTRRPAMADRGPPAIDDLRESQQRFDRPVWFPLRLRLRPSFKGLMLANGHPFLLLVAYFLMFTASTIFFSSYPGVLADGLGYTIGFVLLAQMPSHIINPLTYAWAGRVGELRGEMSAIGGGILVRLVALPAMAAPLLLFGTEGLWLILIGHGLAGLSFSLLQVNGVTLMAKVHRGGRGQGVGNFHATVAMGALVGSASATLMLVWLPVGWTYVPAAALLAAGALLYLAVRRSPQFAARNLPPTDAP